MSDDALDRIAYQKPGKQEKRKYAIAKQNEELEKRLSNRTQQIEDLIRYNHMVENRPLRPPGKRSL